jgi:isocitrate/isopropylmalate dehydrogenase
MPLVKGPDQAPGAGRCTSIDGALREDHVRTGDLGGRAGTKEFTQAVVARLRG